MDPDPVVARGGEIRAGQLGELGDALDRVDLGRKLREHGGLVAGPRAHVEDTLVTAQCERLANPGDHVRLGDRLTPADRKGGVVVGAIAQRARNEQLSRHPLHRREDTLVHDVPATELPLDHVPPQLDGLRRHA